MAPFHADGASDLYQPFLDALHVSGASLAVVSESGSHSSIGSSDALAARIDEMQFELGEGPHWKAARTGELVLLPDIRTSEQNEWPVFATAVGELPVSSLFCVPLRMGAVTVGVATLHSISSRMLCVQEQLTSVAIGSSVARSAVQWAISSSGAHLPAESASAPALRREVHQATGMILVQLNTSATVAYARLQAYAFASNRTLQDVANDVVNGHLSFDESSE